MATIAMACSGCGGTNRVVADRLGKHPKCGRCGDALEAAHPVEADDQALDEVVQSSPVPVLVDFWSPGCAPCKQMAPAVDDLARRHKGALMVVKVDVSQHPRVAGRLGVQAVPTFVVFRQGEAVAREVGAVPQQSLEGLVSEQR